MKNRKVYLTFDMDWAIDEVLEDFNNLLKENDLVGTIHVTHDTPMLELFRKEGILDLGIHPNFNPILQRGERELSAKMVLDDIKRIVPEAVCLRSHALTNSSIMLLQYGEIGIKYDLNTFIPALENMVIYPYASVLSDFMILPFIYEDDVYLNMENKKTVDFFLSDLFVAPRIFNFHPIHLFLNTDRAETYEAARPFFKNSNELLKRRNTSNYGIRDFFLELVTCARENGYEFMKIKDGDWK